VGSRALLIIAGAALLIRTAATAEPLGIDQSLWASAVRAMARGDMLYVDVWEQRPPGIYLTYLAGFAVFGWREATVAWLDITAAALTSVLLWRVGRRLADETTGALTAALFAALTIPLRLRNVHRCRRSGRGTVRRADARRRLHPRLGVCHWPGRRHRDSLQTKRRGVRAGDCRMVGARHALV
jgi:hypothetical protein